MKGGKQIETDQNNFYNGMPVPVFVGAYDSMGGTGAGTRHMDGDYGEQACGCGSRGRNRKRRL